MLAPAPVHPEPLVHLGDCVAWLQSLAPNSVDAIVTDPPYGLGFMGKAWDALPPGKDWAEACLRVLKPGGHLVAFGGTRTVHRLTVAIEDAGFEIRDSIGWVYYSGFPKSLDVSKAIDAAGGATREVVGTNPNVLRSVNARANTVSCNTSTFSGNADITAPATPDAVRWAGWGTALKPAIEPAVLARKPLEGTVAANVLRWGTGGLNIDATRFAPGDVAWVGPQEPVDLPERDVGVTGDGSGVGAGVTGLRSGYRPASSTLGRFPANLYYAPKPSRRERERGCAGLPARTGAEAVDREEGSAGAANPRAGAGRTASAVRNHHPTVKPVRLMRWLVRLVTPSGGIVIDPFLGSGTTGVAALLEGFDFAGCEREAEYHAIAQARMGHALRHPEQWADGARPVRRPRVVRPDPAQRSLFGGGR